MVSAPDANSQPHVELGAAGSDAERRAAVQLSERLLVEGRETTQVEPFRFHRRWALAQALAAGVAVLGSVASVSNVTLGTALVALAAASSILEATGTAPVLARLTGTRASQNVSSPPVGEPRPGLLVLAASYDAPPVTALARLADRVRDPWLTLDAALSAVLACCLLRLLGIEGDALTAVQLMPTLLLLAAVPLLVDVELSPVGEGIGEAAGVESAIALAGRLDDELERLDVWLVLTGAGGALGAGMRAWRRRHRDELDARPAVTIEVGAADPESVADAVELYAGVAHRLDGELADRAGP